MQMPGNTIHFDESFYTDWMQRRGNGFIVRGQNADTNSITMSVKVEVFTKNSEENG